MTLAVRGRAGAAMVAGVAIVLAIDWRAHTTIASLIGAGFVVALASVEFYDLAERKGLNGVAYIDSGYSEAIDVKSLYAEYDKSLRETARIVADMAELNSNQELLQLRFSQLNDEEPGSQKIN